MARWTDVCECCDYITPLAEMTVWRTPIETRTLATPQARATIGGADRGVQVSGAFIYRPAVLEQRVCVHCVARLAAGEPFGSLARNRLKFGLVVCLLLALASAVVFPLVQPLLASAFWQQPDENGRRTARYVVGPRS